MISKKSLKEAETKKTYYYPVNFYQILKGR